MPKGPKSSAPKLLLGLIAFSALLAPVCVYLIFASAPVEQQMGIVQKIFYFHVASAYAMYIGFGVSSVASAVYLAKRSDRWDAFAVAGAEVGSLFCALVLITGPLWARKAWGVWWTWDPRLTTLLLAGMVFFAYLVLRSFGGVGEVEKRFAAGLAVFGLLVLPVIHYSVQRWRGTHPTVVTAKGGGLHPDMVPPFVLSLVLFTALAVALIWLRARVERLRQEHDRMELLAVEGGLLEDV